MVPADATCGGSGSSSAGSANQQRIVEQQTAIDKKVQIKQHCRTYHTNRGTANVFSHSHTSHRNTIAYRLNIFTPFLTAAMNASTSSLVLNGANETRSALSVRVFGRPSALSTPLCLPLEQAEPLEM